ncbi:MAG: hypothetical protein E4G96_09285 [Chrysiogenales bacterium]|nr:MAG: hypothetical protein E4G96_09285 [Chrysiogenales bacterium]
MKKVFGYIALCTLSMAAALAVVWIVPGTHPHDLAAMVNKKLMLASMTPPRIIFVGGSSQLTLDSRLISKELNRKVANMSLWGGLGTREHLEEIAPFLKPGDAVVITMEYAAAIDAGFVKYIHNNDESKKCFFLMSPRRHALHYLAEGRYFELFSIMHDLAQMKVKSYIRNLVLFNFSGIFDIGLPNYATEFNIYGDRVLPYVTVRPIVDSNSTFNEPDWSNHSFINDFTDLAVKRGAKVFFYFSHFPTAYYKKNERYIRAYNDLMREKLNCVILNRPEDFIYPLDYFADTVYHLNQKGERIRSSEMIRMLKRAL